ncbi:MAG: environmental stress-induced protein Ves [Crocinitomicaceae bacterium]|jgi:environmental stress-induced protein Ves
MDIIRFKDAKVTEWSGGQTFEILIQPHGSNFKEGNYDLRVSVATVNLSSTTFTRLPGVSRTLTVLEGDLKLINENNFEVYLKPYQQYSFSGDESIRSQGKVKDFNVMWKNGNAVVKHLSYSQNASVSMESRADVTLFFLAKGSLKCGSEIIKASDSIVAHKALEIRTIDPCEILQVSFNY